MPLIQPGCSLKKKKKMAASSSNLDISTSNSSSSIICQQQDQPQSCHLDWMVQQKEELEELIQVFNHHPHDNEKLLLVTKTIMDHFKDYQGKRMKLALNDSHSIFSATWCPSFENSYLWIAGCRPTLCIRLVYALCGSEAEAHLAEFLQGSRVSKGNLGDLSASQLQMINELQGKTIKEEDILSSQMTGMQEDIVDRPLAVIAHTSNIVGESTEQVSRAIDVHASALASILEDADNLRVNTLMELINILTPVQAVDFLLATKKLHLSMHEWSKTSDPFENISKKEIQI